MSNFQRPMKSLRGEFLGYFTLDILHWMSFKGFTFRKGETFLNTARKPDSVRRLADAVSVCKEKNVKFQISNFQCPMKSLHSEFFFGYFTLDGF